MKSVPVPSHVHYELLLQLLERQSIVAVDKKQHQDQVQQLIATLRKAVVLQHQLEEDLERNGCTLEYRWSLNQVEPPTSHSGT
jgi:exopolyphosphatase/pppGpp-phosphohydrolase